MAVAGIDMSMVPQDLDFPVLLKSWWTKAKSPKAASILVCVASLQ